MKIPEPSLRSSESFPAEQKQAIEGFTNGEDLTSFSMWEYRVEIRVDSNAHNFWVVWRVPIITVISRTRKQVMSACVQDKYTHIAHRDSSLEERKSKWLRWIVRDSIEAIIGIPPFETARLGYLILFLIKRGYIPVGYIGEKGFGASGLLYKDWLPYDKKLQVSDIFRIMEALRETHQLYRSKRLPHINVSKRMAFNYHVRLQYPPEIAQEVYDLIWWNEWNFYEKIDRLGLKIIQKAYK